MSTRCQIQIKSQGEIYPCKIYIHSDGYPENILPFLEDFTNKFHGNRGDDAEYFVAQYLIHLAIKEYEEQNKDPRYQQNPDYKIDKRYTGFGVSTEIHGDIEYLYTADLMTGSVLYTQV
jgi:hypothetical protein